MGKLKNWLGCSALALTTATVAVAAPAPAYAQEQLHSFDIPSQPLAAALLAFSRQSDEMVVASPTVTQGKRSHEVRGVLSTRDAIVRLLRGSGLDATTMPQGGFLIQQGDGKSGEGKLHAASSVRLVQPAASRAQASAEEEEARPAGGLSEIVVTAQRREENLQDVPVAVSAIQAETLEQRQIVDVDSLQSIAPSLTSAPFGDATSPLLSIRGQVAQDLVTAVDPAVGVYLDGVYLGRSTGGNLNFLDVERVEVLRGPQGTLFGRNTIGGAVSITTKQPSDILEGQVSARYGNFDAFGLSGVLNVPLGDAVAFRLAASHTQRDGFARSSLTGAELNGQNIEYVRGTLKAELSPDWDITVSGDFTDSRNSGQWFTLIKAYPLGDTVAAVVSGGTQTATQYVDPYTRRPASNSSGPIISRNWGVGGTISGMIGAVNVKSITSYREVTRRLNNLDQDGSPFELLQLLSNVTLQDQFSQEFQLYGKAIDDRLDWIVGAYYFTETGRETVTAHFVYPLNPTISITDADATNRNLAIYGQLTYDLTDQLSVVGGIRYARDKRILTLYSRTSGATPDAVLACATAGATVPDCAFPLPKKSFDYAPFTIGLNWQPGPNTLIYAKWSRGFRSGGQNTRGKSADTLFPFGPEKVDSYELGAKFEIDRRFRVNAAVFQSDFDDIQILTSVASSVGTLDIINQNAGKARIRGLEFEGEAVFGHLRLNASLAILDAKFKRLDPNVIGLQLDSPFTLTPKTTWSLSGDYDIPMDFGEIVLHTDFAWRSRSFFLAIPPNDPINQQKSYGLLNASVTVNVGDDISVAAFGKNLADKKYFNRTTGIPALGFASAYPGDPRTYGVSATYRF